MPKKEGIDLSSVYPNWPPERLEEAEENLTRYVDVIRRIYERSQGIKNPLEVE